MNRFSKGKRVLSLLLAMVLLISMLPPIAVPVYSETPDDVPATEDFKKYIGCNAWFAGYTTPLAVAPENVSDPLTNECVQFDASDATALKLVIVDCYYNEKNDTLWYKVKAAPGYELPEAVAAAPWVFQDYVANPWSESLIVSEPKMVTGAVNDSEGNPVLDSNGEPLEVTVSGGLPAGAELKVTVPEISGEKHGNVFDIKVLAPDENGEMIEWQPIDEGKTVTVSIPVDTDAEYVDVYHYIDYAIDINGDENIVPVDVSEDNDVGFYGACIDAYDTAKGTHDHFAYEKYEKAKVKDGRALINTDSFSVYYYDSGTYGDSDGNTEAINFEPNNKDNGKHYFVTRGTVIKTTMGWNFTASWTTPNGFTRDGNNFTVTESAELYTTYAITLKNWLGSSTIYFTVMPELTLNFAHNIDREVSVSLPAERAGIFMGTYSGEFPTDKDTMEQYFQEGKYPALNQTLDMPVINDQYKDAYQFEYWYTQHNPDKIFTYEEGKTSTTLWLSNSNLEVNMDDKTISNYEVTLVAKFKPVDFRITFDTAGGTIPSGVATIQNYTIEDVLTMPTPTRANHAFLGWKVTSAAGNWTEGTIISDGSSVHDMYGNVTLTAQWVEISDATYRVEHYLQDTSLSMNLDTYLLTYTDTLAGKPGDFTNAAAKNLRGFTAQTFTQVEITEDNQAVVKIYYNRNTYTISFDANGGDEGTTPADITQAYGAFISAPTAPTKAGYVFRGWYAASAPAELYNFTTMPANNLTLYAKWEAKKITITIVNVTDGEVDGVLDSINQDAETALTTPANPVRTGYTFGGWFANEACTQAYTFPSKMPTADKTVYAKWTANQYEIIFELEGGKFQGDVENPAKYKYGTVITGFENIPTKTGHTFLGWAIRNTSGSYMLVTDDEGNVALPNGDNSTIMGAANLTLYAQWSVEIYTITWIVDGVTTTEQYEYGAEIVKPADPSKPGWKFIGWSGEVPATMPAHDLSFEAQFEQDLTSLTITVTGCYDAGQSFLFTLTGQNVNLTVAVYGNSSVTIDGLNMGRTYTVTLKDDWSWRYDEETAQTITIVADAAGNVVIFDVDRTNGQWLDGNDYLQGN